MISIKKILSTKLIFLFSLVFCFAQNPDNSYTSDNSDFDLIKLSEQNTSWSKVISGKSLVKPQTTSYGFVTITDARNICGYTNEGKLYFDQKISRTPDPLITVLPYDFIVLITNDRQSINLLNSTGYFLWTRILDSPVIEKPVAGRDGRFFILTQTELLCLGMNGIYKWKLSLEDLEISHFNEGKNFSSIQEFSDGSILLLSDNNLIRISPFGTILDSLTISSNIIDSVFCDNGVILSLENNKIIMLDVNSQNEVETIWAKEPIHKATITVNKNRLSAAIFSNDEIELIETKTGNTIQKFSIQKLNKNIAESVYNEDGIFLCTDSNGYFYSEDGLLLWKSEFPDNFSFNNSSVQNNQNSKNKNHILFTDDNHLLFFSENWTIDAYKVFQSSQKSYPCYKNTKDYTAFYSTDNSQFDAFYKISLDQMLTDPKTLNFLKEGFYGAQEAKIISKLYSATKTYYEILNTSSFGVRTEESIFKTETQGVCQTFLLLSAFGTDTFNEHTAMFLLREKNPSYLSAVLRAISLNGYDPEDRIANALINLSTNPNIREKSVVCGICDAVYSLSGFMGKTFFNSKGKIILKTYLHPSFSPEIREYTRKTFEKMVKILAEAYACKPRKWRGGRKKKLSIEEQLLLTLKYNRKYVTQKEHGNQFSK